MNTRTLKASLALLSLLPYFAHAQGGPPPLPAPPPPSPNDTLVSPSVGNDGRVTIQIYAPKADEVRLTGDSMSGRPEPIRLEQDARGVWSATVRPLAPDYYS